MSIQIRIRLPILVPIPFRIRIQRQVLYLLKNDDKTFIHSSDGLNSLSLSSASKLCHNFTFLEKSLVRLYIWLKWILMSQVAHLPVCLVEKAREKRLMPEVVHLPVCLVEKAGAGVLLLHSRQEAPSHHS